MDLVLIGLAIFGGIGTIVTLIAGYIQIRDARFTSRLEASKFNLPINIRRSISHRNYLEALKKLKEKLEQDRFVPDFIIGVHYGGLSCATDLAKIWHKPILHIETRYREVNSGQPPICEEVILKFPKEQIENMKILLIDNSINSGRTLKMALEEITKHAKTVKTVKTGVIYQKNEGSGGFFKPDYILFKSTKALESLIK